MIGAAADADISGLIMALTTAQYWVALAREPRALAREATATDAVVLDVTWLDDITAHDRIAAGPAKRAPMIALVSDAQGEATAIRAGCADAVRAPWTGEVITARVGLALSRHEPPGRHRTSDIDLVDPLTRRVRVGDRSLTLTPKQWGLLAVLLERQGSVVERKELLAHVWGHQHHGHGRVLDVRMSELRRRLGPDIAARIETVHGFGYRYTHGEEPLATAPDALNAA